MTNNFGERKGKIKMSSDVYSSESESEPQIFEEVKININLHKERE